MLLSVTQEGKGIFYFAGDLDEYNFELLREHAGQLGAIGAELRIKVDAHEENALRDRAQEWLTMLADAGVAVRVERNWSPADRRLIPPSDRRSTTAAPKRALAAPASRGTRATSWSGVRTGAKETA